MLQSFDIISKEKKYLNIKSKWISQRDAELKAQSTGYHLVPRGPKFSFRMQRAEGSQRPQWRPRSFCSWLLQTTPCRTLSGTTGIYQYISPKFCFQDKHSCTWTYFVLLRSMVQFNFSCVCLQFICFIYMFIVNFFLSSTLLCCYYGEK